MARPKALPPETLPPDIRALIERDGPYCVWCSRLLGLKTSDASREHVVPASKGGKSTLDNYLLSCHSCNNKRKSKKALDWMETLKREGKEVQEELILQALARVASAGTGAVKASKLTRRKRLALKKSEQRQI